MVKVKNKGSIMNQIRYSLLMLVTVGYGALLTGSYTVVNLDDGVYRLVTTPQGRIHKMGGKYFDEEGKITAEGIDRIKDYEARKAAESHLVEPVAAKVAAKSKKGPVTFAPTANVKTYQVDREIEGKSIDYESDKDQKSNISFDFDQQPDHLVRIKKFKSPYIPGSSRNGEVFGQEISDKYIKQMNQKRQESPDNSRHRYETADLYIQDPELGEVFDVLGDFSRIWIDNSGVKYHIGANMFDESGNLTSKGRDAIRKAQQDRRDRLSQSAAAVDPVVEERMDDEFSGAMVPVAQIVGQFTHATTDDLVDDGDQRILTKEFVDNLRELSDQQIIQMVPKIVDMPNPVTVVKAENLSVDDLQDIFRGTIDLAGDMTTNFLERFFNVRCENEQTLNLYTEWLETRLARLIQKLFIQKKQAVEKHYFVVQQEKLEEENNNQYAAVTGLKNVDKVSRLAKVEGTLSVGLPIVVKYTSIFKDRPIVRTVLVGSSFLLAAVEIKAAIDKLSQLRRDKKRLSDKKAQAEKNLADLNALPKSMSEGSVKLFNENLGRFVQDMDTRIKDLADKENKRIRDELAALQAPKSSVPAIQDRTGSGAPKTTASIVLAGSPTNKRQFGMRALGFLVRGVNAVAELVSR